MFDTNSPVDDVQSLVWKFKKTIKWEYYSKLNDNYLKNNDLQRMIQQQSHITPILLFMELYADKVSKSNLECIKVPFPLF
jgi:hypothetical protein